MALKEGTEHREKNKPHKPWHCNLFPFLLFVDKEYKIAGFQRLGTEGKTQAHDWVTVIVQLSIHCSWLACFRVVQ